jgi:hypothetical protein
MQLLIQERLRWLGGLVIATLCGCGPRVSGSAIPTRTADDVQVVDASSVRVSVLTVPEGAGELGIVQARTTQGNIEDAMPEFRAQVARLGGDFGKINNVSTKFETETRTRNESYNCGTADKPQTCTRTVTEDVEISTTAIIGKAYRLGAAPPAAPPANAAAIVDPHQPPEASAPASPERATTSP